MSSYSHTHPALSRLAPRDAEELVWILCVVVVCVARVCLCSRVAQRVLRYGDMEYVMLHLIFIYLTPGEGQPAAYAASDL